MKTITFEEWHEKGNKLFGADMRTWIFVCPMCKTKQSINDFVNYAAAIELEKIYDYIGFSCIGRFTKEIGCDWTLGGLLHIHQTEVQVDSHLRKIFEFFEKGENETAIPISDND